MVSRCGKDEGISQVQERSWFDGNIAKELLFIFINVKMSHYSW